MKYPQLVSTRAVNAISDWLVSRLEQLGVEAPQIYTRLLLSLLQSTIQLNDPIEFSNLESFFASRKGGNRRYLDTDALKKFNAVQCLKDIVSSEQEIATIENLVDELCEKLKDIEKQTGDSEDEDKQLVATLSLAQQQHHNSSHQHHHHHGHTHLHKSHHNNQTKEVPTHSKSCSASSRSDSSKNTQAAVSTAAASANNQSNNNNTENLDDSELDPRDLYFRAFPALSKEMEDSFVTWRRNAKWLTWPVDQRNQDQSISTSSSSSTISSNSAVDAATKDAATSSVNKVNAKDKRMDDALENASKVPRQEFCNDFADVNDSETNSSAFASVNAATGGIKRKSKRRRSRALLKGKTIQQSSRKKTSAGMACGSSSALMHNHADDNPSAAGASGKSKRSASPAYWDTDFEGCWEMGRDLIKEFITRQNRNSRNRSTSESAVAYKKKSTTEERAALRNATIDYSSANEKALTDGNRLQNKNHATGQSSDIECDKTRTTKVVTPILPPVDISFCDYDDYDDTLASVSELTHDGPLVSLATADGAADLATVNAKRLYERELIPTDAKSDEQLDFAQFEAKFNSSVEALWKDAGSDEEKGFKPIGNGNKMQVFGFGSGSSTHFSGPASLPFDVPFSQNVKNFWANYYNHHFDLSKMLPTSVIGQKAKELDVVMQRRANDIGRGDAFKPNGGFLSDDAPQKPNNFSRAPADVTIAAPTTTSDYYSMPSNLDNLNNAKLLRCGLRHNSGCSDCSIGAGMGRGGTIGEERKTPVALFLQSSIWSENANRDGGDTDESFYFKVHNSGKQLNQYNAPGNNSMREQKMQGGTNTGGSFGFTATYTSSKWSEGINAGPPQNNLIMAPSQQMTHKQGTNLKENFNISLRGTDCTDSSPTASFSTTSGTNWQQTKTNANTDLENTWPPGISPNVEKIRETNTSHRAPTRDAIIENTPTVTLANHSSANSGFIEYSRIKSVPQLQLSTQDNASSANLAKEQLPRNYPPRANSKEQQQQRCALDMIDDSENLLTSERTHFHPIRSYVDGHTFDICSELDVIEYERSASGYLYLEQDKYLEYTRTDNFMVEDDGGVGASANPLYANSNCEAATASASANYKNAIGNSKSKRIERDFVIKFRLQRTEIACQTDAEPPTARAVITASKRFSTMSLTATSQPHPLSLIFSNAAKNLKANAANELVYSDTVEAFTRAIAHCPPPPPQTANNSTWLPLGAADFGGQQSGNRNWKFYQQQSKVCKNTKKNTSNLKSHSNDYDDDDDEAGCDEVDFYGSAADVADMNHRSAMEFIDTDVDMISLEQQWSMNEIRKKCKEAGHMATYASANNNNNNASGAGDAAADGVIESVWGMCAACNSELKSIPANRLLRDELQVEADEIMSDLKYMQDLYIGRAGDANDADDEDEGCADDDSGADTVTSDSDWCNEDVTAELAEEGSVKPMPSVELAIRQADSTSADKVASDTAATNDSDTFSVIQKVNRLIAELLRPDNNNDTTSHIEKLNAHACASVEESRPAERESATMQFSGNLWHNSRNERNIWQLNAADSTTGIMVGGGGGLGKGSSGIHPMQLLRQFNVKPMESATNVGNVFPLPTADDADKYHTQISWEHENLAKIWQTSPPPPLLPPPPQQQTHQPPQNQPQDANMEVKYDRTAAAAVNQSECDEKTDIDEKNMRNLRANADASVEAAAANLQEAQEFLTRGQSKVVALTDAQLVDSALKLKAVTRKRRHSASQNYFHAQLNNSIGPAAGNSSGGNASLMQNNNNNEIADLNNYVLKSSSSNANELSFQNLLNVSLRFGAAAAAAVAASHAKKGSDYGSRNICGADIAYGCDATAAAARNHTIITCKYHLTAIEPLSMHNDDDGIDDVGLFGTGNNGSGITAAPLSCLIDKNQSILKHVTMVSRPLTR
ncbi:serine-rich adhesin for platelets-like [Rhagoletis pomonella]|uniref:serine-rich adhesin for platelets-like n=1 Tax=Rhagoletis pomonella TaxID=28610 RepID=UPI001781CC82|nr:serine-rich adhesin for platelets-like [Rhagoletis pomonella]XP_036318987.1 serine-rich adhesin for platelets-like [Rhagoletis pomonella]XP_036318988.1 serine-rich adhesin for platelets-like [Rhagoletis pomonella]XP_036318989.1 serine-rich adhesin for platelets-like [Rhagoletis pomonella]XP_036318990.1 serine-rich adhesin for platelets-like [Rhagoletis pomonella]XP_036318991.1 serine-rich adhesin for platelets-like [Rhagoletis pomonella]XP_036318992.1 serine-rich adhesin for platelets-like